ncbi:tyrosine-protein phosphatase [Pseudaeromonas paramecii]|uniref:Cyclin-dependent kinase inhibitor 3 family protein n=1 Tax=Pseudaeromonas paramecii TaxID=2138166 RepID=A0ABP8QHW3_9GAMM
MSSSSHPLFELPLAQGGALGLMPCPGTQSLALVAALQQVKAWGAQAVLTLMEPDELVQHGVGELGHQVQALGLTWFHLPIEDDHAPEAAFATAWAQQGPAILALLQGGGKLALHCRGGTGRTGLIAARLLLALGWPEAEAVAAVKALRPKALSLPVHCQWLAQQA